MAIVSEKPYIPCGKTYNSYPTGSWGGGLIFKDITTESFKYSEQIDFLNILIKYACGNDGRGGYLQSNHFQLLKRVLDLQFQIQ